MELCFDDYSTLEKVKEQSVSVEKLDAYGSQNSFYGKAKVYTMPNGSEVLVSYTTPVVVWDKESGFVVKLQENNRYTTSRTTMRHINAFLKRIGKQEHLWETGVKKWKKTITM